MHGTPTQRCCHVCVSHLTWFCVPSCTGAEDGQKSLVDTLKAVLTTARSESVEEETVEDQDQQFADTLSSHGSMCS